MFLKLSVVTDVQLRWRYSYFRDAIRVMILIHFAISIFALTLVGYAFSFSPAQSPQANLTTEPTTLIHR